MCYFFYRIISFLIFPLLKGWIFFRLSKKKEDKNRFKERYGISSQERPKGKLYWFHGASIGECLSFLPVLNYFEKNYPSYTFLITSGTQTSADLLKKRLSKKCIHQYVPLDHPIFVSRFLSHWRPNAGFWTESDFWPSLIIQTSKICPLFLLNGKLSSKSLGRWSVFTPLISRVLKSFSLIFPQSIDDLRRFKSLGLSHLKMLGNLKYEGQKLKVPLERVHEIKKEIGKHSLWIASNTHEGEEEIILDIHRKLQQILGKSLILFLIPRHPHRWETIRLLLNKYGFSYIRRSESEKIKESTDVFVVDSLGELGVFYSLSPFVVMGGSFISGIGGHNVLEPARLGCLPVFGPYMENNKGMADLLLKNKAAIQAKTSTQLEKTVYHLLKDQEGCKKQARNAAEILKNVNILQPILNEIKKHLHD